MNSNLTSSDARLRLLADTGRVLADRSCVHDVALAATRLAELLTASFASCCVIDIVERDGSMRRVAARHRDRTREATLARVTLPAPGGWSVLADPSLGTLGVATLRADDAPLGALAVCVAEGATEDAREVIEEIAGRFATTVELWRLVGEQRAQALRHSAITSNATLGLVMMDARQHCTFMNPAAEAIFGYRLDEVQGRPLHDFVHHTHPDGRPYPIAECPIDRALPTRMQETGEDVFVRRDGTFYPVRFTASPIVEDGVAVGTVIEVQDITEERRHAAEQRRREAHAFLSGEVGAALTREMTLRPALDRCAQAIVRHLGAAFARIWTLDDATATLELQASAGMYTHIDGGHARVPVGSFKIGKIAADAAPHLTNNVLHDPLVGDPAWAAREGMVAFAGHPLIVNGKVVGVMAMFAREPLEEATLDALASVADAIAVGVERARVDVQRREVETRYRFATRATQDAIWDWNLTNNHVAWNDSVQDLFGHTHAEIPQTAAWWIEQIHPDDRQRVGDSIHHAIDHGSRDWRDQYRFRRSDGSYAFVTDRGFIERADDGTPLRMVGAMQDITARLSAEQGWRFLAEASQVLSSSLDPETVLRRVVEASVPGLTDWAALDLREGDSIRRVAVAHIDPEKVALAHTLVEKYPSSLDDPTGVGRVLRTGEPEMVELITDDMLARSTDDPERLAIARALGLVSYIVVPIVLDGRTLGALTWVHAESRRRFSMDDLALARAVAERAATAFDNARLYQELQTLNANLERRVQERTAELQELNSQLESFTYSISHDLRAPLRHIGGFAQLLQRRANAQLDDKSREFVEMIIDAASKGGRLVDDLLAFSRLGRTEMKKVPIDLGPLLEDVRRELAPEWEGRSVTWKIDRMPRVLGDESLLRSVLKNLVSNALKYSKTRAESVIEIGTQEHDAEQEIFVRDNGVGFDMAYVDKLFGVFQRLHNSPEFEGTGIGLANVRRIVHRHGGRAWGTGAVDQGATFHVTLPKPTGLGRQDRSPREPTHPAGRR